MSGCIVLIKMCKVIFQNLLQIGIVKKICFLLQGWLFVIIVGDIMAFKLLKLRNYIVL